MIYRRGVSVIISPSLSRPTLGSERGLSRGGAPPLAPLPPFPNLSICTLPATVIAVARSHLSAHRSRSLRGTLEWPRRPFSSVGAPHSPFLSSIVSANFPRASRGTGVGSRGDAVSVPRRALFLSSFRRRDGNPGGPRSSLSLSISSGSSPGSNRGVSRRR